MVRSTQGRSGLGPVFFPTSRRRRHAHGGELSIREFNHLGVAGFWNDMNEPSVFDTVSKTVPVDVIHRIDEPGFGKRKATHAEIHNVYGMENSRATFEGLKT